MKRNILILFLIFISGQIAIAQEHILDRLIKDYAKKENAILREMDRTTLLEPIEKAIRMDSTKLDADIEKLYTEYPFDKVTILTLKESPKDVWSEFAEDVKAYNDDENYKTLLKIKKDGLVDIITKKGESFASELFLIIQKTDDVAIVKIEGRLKESDIEELTEQYK